MATALRLLRTGTTKRPNYRLVVIDQARANKGGIIENLGAVSVLRADAVPVLNTERVKHWLSQGVVASESAKGVLKKAGLWTAPPASKPKHKSAAKAAKKAAGPTPAKKK
jgi:small subunit ribosomal protein S16